MRNLFYGHKIGTNCRGQVVLHVPEFQNSAHWLWTNVSIEILCFKIHGHAWIFGVLLSSVYLPEWYCAGCSVCEVLSGLHLSRKKSQTKAGVYACTSVAHMVVRVLKINSKLSFLVTCVIVYYLSHPCDAVSHRGWFLVYVKQIQCLMPRYLLKGSCLESKRKLSSILRSSLNKNVPKVLT